MLLTSKWLRAQEVFSVLQALYRNYSSTVKKLDTEMERAERDVSVVGGDLSQLIGKVP